MSVVPAMNGFLVWCVQPCNQQYVHGVYKGVFLLSCKAQTCAGYWALLTTAW